MRFILAILFFILLSVNAFALQTVSPNIGETTTVNISAKDLNVIKTPFKSVKAFSSSPDIDVNVDGSNVLIKFTGTELKTKDLVITDDRGNVYPFVLIPTGIPLEVIKLEVKDTEKDDEPTLGGKATATHIGSIKSLIKNMYLNKVPFGYTVENLNKDETEWNEVKKVLKKRYKSPTVIGEVYELKANEDVVLAENEFYRKGILAISIDSHKLKKNETTRLYIIKKR